MMRRLAPASGETAPPSLIRHHGASGEVLPARPEFVGINELLASLLRRGRTLLLFILAGVSMGILITIPQKPAYQARALIEIQSLNTNFLNRRDIEPNVEFGELLMDTYIQTQLKLLQSESLAGRVVDRLQVPTWPDYQEHSRQTSALASNDDRRQTAVETALKHLTVRVSGQTRLVEVLFEAGDPARASAFTNALIDEYIAGLLENRVHTARQTGDLLAGQLQDLKSEVERSETRLQDYALGSGLVFTSEKDNVAEGRLRQLQASLAVAQDARTAEQSKYEIALQSPPDSLPDVLDSQTLRSYHVNLTDLRRQRADLSEVLTPTHYKVRQLDAQIAELQSASERERGNILSRIRNQYESAARRQRLLEDEYAGQLKTAATQAARAVRYDSLKREVDMRRLLYEATLQRVKEADVASAIRANNVRVVDPARAPRKPIRPNRTLNAAIGLLAGTFFGVGFVLFTERRQPHPQIPSDTRARLQMPELGTIPSACNADSQRQRATLPPWFPGNGHGPPANGPARPIRNWLQVVTLVERDSALAESFRGALASLLFSANNGVTPRVIVITSASAGEGKTTVTTNLGIALAATNRRVLLIDGNRRNPRLHDIFRVPGTWGFSDLLQSMAPCDEYAS
ncbi:MAG: exopolysaccharide transport family protein, partial [Acidobacteriota bacterium]|nr:exopolysaccharide transport family protein [Acidobacteriota bacterium]